MEMSFSETSALDSSRLCQRHDTSLPDNYLTAEDQLRWYVMALCLGLFVVQCNTLSIPDPPLKLVSVRREGVRKEGKLFKVEMLVQGLFHLCNAQLNYTAGYLTAWC